MSSINKTPTTEEQVIGKILLPLSDLESGEQFDEKQRILNQIKENLSLIYWLTPEEWWEEIMKAALESKKTASVLLQTMFKIDPTRKVSKKDLAYWIVGYVTDIYNEIFPEDPEITKNLIEFQNRVIKAAKLSYSDPNEFELIPARKK